MPSQTRSSGDSRNRACQRIHPLVCKMYAMPSEQGRSLQLVDVRSSAEWLQGHLPGAISMPLLDLNSQAASIDPFKLSLVYCQEGYRAMTAASMLLRDNPGDIGILIDGIQGWQAYGLPLETSEASEPSLSMPPSANTRA